MAESSTQRTLKRLRKDGWLAEVTERWNMHAKIRQDLFGFIDVIAIDPDGCVLAVQATTADHISHRVEKIRQHKNLARVLTAGWAIEVWGWKKYAKKVDGKSWRASIRTIR